MDNPYFVKTRSQLSVLHDTEMEQQHLENLKKKLKKQQETILVKIKKKWEKKNQTSSGTALPMNGLFHTSLVNKRETNVKNAYKIKHCIREKDGDCS